MSSNPLATSYSPVPQFDLGAQFAVIGDEIRDAVDRVLSSHQFILAAKAPRLEEEIAQLCGVAHGVGVGSGPMLSSLRCAPAESGWAMK